MGKASKWFRGLLGLKKQEPSSSYTQNPSPTKPTKKKWSFVKSYREKDSSFAKSNDKTLSTNYGEPDGVTVDPAKRAIAVAEATAVVAEAAIAAAQAAAAVVKLTSSGRATTTSSSNSTSGGVADVMTWNGVAVNSSSASSAPAVNRSRVHAVSREESAAIVIQSHFRAYLSRRALRALKGLVKLQALVRGHLLRQHTADYFRQMQALIRAQVRARAGRSQLSDSPHSSSKSVHFLHADPTTPEKFEHVIRARSDETFMLKRNTLRSSWKAIDPEKARVRTQGSSGRTNSTDDEKSDRILEIDSGKPYVTPKRRNLFHSLNSDQYSYSLTTSKESTAHQTVPNSDLEEVCFCTADNSPQFYSASSKGGSSKRGPFTPTKSDGYLSGYSDHPNYMSYTESAKAKVRSMSAPKQRHHYESSSSTKRFSVHGYSESRTNSHKGSFYGSFTGKAYPGSGRLDRLGMPVRADPSGFSGGLQHRY